MQKYRLAILDSYHNCLVWIEDTVPRVTVLHHDFSIHTNCHDKVLFLAYPFGFYSFWSLLNARN